MTSGTILGSSTSIATYNNFVTNTANAQPELAALEATWFAIASTPSVHALTNTGTDPASPTQVPIYLLDGNRLVDDYTHLWDGTVQRPLNVTEAGMVASVAAWTGSNSNGYGYAQYELGAGIWAGPFSRRPLLLTGTLGGVSPPIAMPPRTMG